MNRNGWQAVLLLMALGLGLPEQGGAFGAETVASRWAATPPEIDGRIEDWQGEATFFQKSVGVEYALRNDGGNLYVLFIFKNPKFLSSVEMTGITMYAGAAGKKDKGQAVKFIRKTVSGEQFIDYMEKQGKPLTDAKRREFVVKPQLVVFEATAVNKRGEEIFPAGPVPDIDLPGFRHGRVQEGVAYELRVPLCSRDIHPAGIGAGPGDVIGLGFEWGGMTEEMKAATRGRGSGMTGADLTGERATGSYDGRVPDVSQGPKRYSFRVDVKLASS